ncbi:MAG: FHA domain-containing protein [Dehalococcoidia bacterium]|nr:FHA domain-containing protein [Dehalococcoidia bacterium]
MSQDLAIFALRIGIIVLLYLFLTQIAVLIVRDLRDSSSPDKTTTLSDWLVVIEGNIAGWSAGDSIPLELTNSLGRSPGSAIRLIDDFVSARHALLDFKQKSWWVEDLGSTNGTTVNGKTVNKATKVLPGDVVQIGVSKFRLTRR